MHRVSSVGNNANSNRPRKEKRLRYVLSDTDDTKHCAGINCLAVLKSSFSDGCNYLFTGSRDGTLKRWALDDDAATCSATFESHVDWVNDTVIAGDNTLVSCSSDTTLKTWNCLSDGICTSTLRQHSDYVTCLAAAEKNTNVVASGGLGGEVFVWDIEAAVTPLSKSSDVLEDNCSNGINGSANSLSISSLRTISSSNSIAAQTAQCHGYVPICAKGHKESVYALAINDSGSLLVSGGTEKVVRVWDPRTGLKTMKLRGHTDNIRALLMDSTGRYCLSGSSDSMIRLWDLGQQRCVHSYAVHMDSVWALASTPTFSHVYSGGRDLSLYLTDLTTRESLLLCTKEHPILQLALHGDSIWVATTDSSVHRWPAEGKNPQKVFQRGGSFLAGNLSFSRARVSLEGSTPAPVYKEPIFTIPGTPAIVHYEILNNRRHVLTKEQESGKMIGTTKVNDGLYVWNKNSSQEGMALSTSKDDPIMLWHRRLGHPNFMYLKKLFPLLFLNKKISSLNCEVCQLSKHIRVPYPLKPYVQSQPFSLIHSDLWGASRVKNITGARWFITFIDDHTRVCWVYLLKEKSEVSRVFKNFHSMIRTQFNSNIHTLRTDNGREYFNSILSPYLSEQGIIHQSSCPDTPQQNGVSERKNRHLVAVARALMFTMGVPKYLWGEAVLTACYLINRLPSKVLNFQTPLHTFQKKFPLFRVPNLPTKTFGCKAFVHNHQPNQSKLDPRAHTCVFIGYSPAQKGYKCYSPTLHRMFVSLDVTFFENEPYFSASHLQGEILSEDETLSNLLIISQDFISPTTTTKPAENPTATVIPVLEPVSPTTTTKPAENPTATVVPVLEPVFPISTVQQQETRVINHTNEEKQPTHSEKQQGKTQGLRVYSRRHQLPETETAVLMPSLPEDCPEEEVSPPSSSIHLPIAVRKGTRSCTQHPISRFVSYGNLSKSYNAFVYNVDCVETPKNIDKTPMEPNLKLGTDKDGEEVDRGRYQREKHLEAAYRILRYLKGTPGKGLHFKKDVNRSIEVYTDADWAGAVNDRRSTSGYCSYVWGNLVTWRSKKQSVVARSSAESEYRALSHGICEGMWLQRLMGELKLSYTKPNQAAVSIRDLNSGPISE